MTIHLPARAGESPVEDAGPEPALDRLSPRQIVAALDRDVVGQQPAKRAVAIALRNRIRRQQLPARTTDSEVGADEVTPKNIILIGPTGVGKTEIARRLARLAASPFVKVEASKFTEVGYVGRDVESMIRDLVEIGVDLVRSEKQKEVAARAERNTEEKLLSVLLPGSRIPQAPAGGEPGPEEDRASVLRTREKLREKLRAGELEESLVELEVQEGGGMPMFRIWTGQGMEEMNLNLKESLPGLFGKGRGHKRRMTVAEARGHLRKEEEDKLIDPEQLSRLALERVEQSGIVFLDEIDKIAGRGSGGQGPDVSREGVQRDLLPIVEGTTVNTKHGRVRTDHILFIASGAFHMSSPSDLIPELQGRFPIRVELDALQEEDFVRILTEPRGALTKQYTALLRTEGVELRFTEDGVRAIARFAAQVNEASENIGARRLHTLMERLLKEILFEGADLDERRPVIDRAHVEEALRPILQEARESSGRIGFSPLGAEPTS